MVNESNILKAKLRKDLQLSSCVSQGLVNELNNEIDSSIDDLISELRIDPSNKDVQYRIDDLVALRDETLSRIDVCGRTIEKVGR